MNNSRFIRDGENKHSSRLISTFADLVSKEASYIDKPKGMWGANAKIKCNGLTIDSEQLDLEFVIPFDDDLEPNEAKIIIYNLTNSTIKKMTRKSEISIEAGYGTDTGVIFKGYISKIPSSKYEGADKVTTIKCVDDVENRTIESKAYDAGTKASTILKDLIGLTKMTLAVFSCPRDHTYTEAVTVDGDVMENIKKYSEVCGVSTYTLKNKVYCRPLSDGDSITFIVKEETGMIGSPSYFEEEIKAEDYTDTVKGYEVEMLLQHRMQTAAIFNLSSREVNGQFRVKSGEHRFNASEAITKVKAVQ